MNSREIMLRAIEFRHPVRIPGTMPPPYWHDMAMSGTTYPQPASAQWHPVDALHYERIDEWGNLWTRLDQHSHGEVSRGALQDLDQAAHIPLPDLANPAYFEMAREVFASQSDRFRVGSLPGFAFGIARKMRRLDQYLMDLALNPAKIMVLHERLDDLIEQMIRQYAAAGADGVMIWEDWGTQASLMISPSMWRQIFKPGFERLCRVTHELGLKMLMHSCGKVTAIIPDLIEVGVDVLQFDQPQLHGIDTLAQWSGQVAFWCPVDIQDTLQTHDPTRIEREAREMIEKLGNKGGGFIAGFYVGGQAIDMPFEIQEIACKAFTRYGWYEEPATTAA